MAANLSERPRDPIERFWFNVEKGGKDDCWEWKGSVNTDGYGKFKLNHKLWLAHRCSYWIEHGPIKKGFWVLQRCNNNKCVNPNHLFLSMHVDDPKNYNENWEHLQS